jgi:nitroreductase
MDTILRDAFGLIIATVPKGDNNGMVNLTLALSYLELAAPGLGLGTCWAGLLQGALLFHKPLKQAPPQRGGACFYSGGAISLQRISRFEPGTH